MSLCVSCSSPLKPNAKCCTQCGTRVAAAPPLSSLSSSSSSISSSSSLLALCPDCRSPLKPNAKCCTSCGRRVTTSTPSPSTTPGPLPPSSSSTPTPSPLPDRRSPPCWSCHAPLKANAKFCTNCGKRPDERPSSSPSLVPPSLSVVPTPAPSSSSSSSAAPTPSVAPPSTTSTSSAATAVVASAAAAPASPLLPGPRPARRQSVRRPRSPSAQRAKKPLCEACGHQLKDDRVIFCTKCGVKQALAAQRMLANEGQACGTCKAELKSGMSFCTKCGSKVDSSAQASGADDAALREKRKKAAEKAEAELEKAKAELAERENAAIAQVNERRRKRSVNGVPCAKCQAVLKPQALFCTKCGEKNTKSEKNLMALLGSLNSSSGALLSVEELAALRAADEEYAAEIAKIKEDSNAHLKRTEEALLRSLIEQDYEISQAEDYSAQLTDLESKANDAEAELMAAVKAFQELSASSDGSEPSPPPSQPKEAPRRPAPVAVSLADVDPSKYGIRSFATLFSDLDSSPAVPATTTAAARDIISLASKLQDKVAAERQNRADRAKELETSTKLDDLDAELKDLSDADLDDADLDDADFAAVGGKYVRKTRIDSDDDDSSN